MESSRVRASQALPGRTVTFADGTTLDVDAVVWATGYRSDYSWLALPVLDENGRIRHRRGVSDVPGLYFLGLSWQHHPRLGAPPLAGSRTTPSSSSTRSSASRPVRRVRPRESHRRAAARQTAALPEGA